MYIDEEFFKEDYISASTARNIAEETNRAEFHIKTIEELRWLETMIQNAANHGDFSIVVDKQLRDQTIEFLEKKGFEINLITTQTMTSGTKISGTKISF